jgi:hypothetical protein
VDPLKDNETNRDQKTLAKKREDMGQEDARQKNDESSPIGSMYGRYKVTITINIPQLLAYIPYMDPMGHGWIMLT